MVQKTKFGIAIQDTAREWYRRQGLGLPYKTQQGNGIEDKVWDCHTRQIVGLSYKTKLNFLHKKNVIFIQKKV